MVTNEEEINPKIVEKAKNKKRLGELFLDGGTA